MKQVLQKSNTNQMKSFFANAVKYYQDRAPGCVGGSSMVLGSAVMLPHIMTNGQDMQDGIIVVCIAGVCGGIAEYLTPPYLKCLYPLAAFFSIVVSAAKTARKMKTQR